MNKLHTNEIAVESYDPAFLNKLIRIEDRHFWFHARNQVIATLVEQTEH